MLKIWGRLSSINVRKVVWTAQELGLDFQRTDAGGQFGVVKTPEYMRMNPNSLVPLLDDEGYLLWESNVIVRYLCAKHAMGRLYPTGLQPQFDAERWMDWQQTTFNPAGRNAFWQLIRTPAEQRQPELIERSVAATEPLLAMLDEHLSRSAYVGGAAFGMADVPLACEIHRWWGLPLQRTRHPNIERWYAEITARPATRGVLDQPLS